MSLALQAESLGKCYRVDRGDPDAAGSYRTLRDDLVKIAGAPLRMLRRGVNAKRAAEPFWALKDVDLEVKPGEVVGLVGRNGAGKSTLLKILSRITRPSTGRATLTGRVGSLLEVGTGFHPELTGRENISLNGAILGMSRAEIARKFDEIVAFSEVGPFLDTPVKRYSSGMYVRLAFAVAAHLEPEILVVDEVLAVGDAGFQKKCLGKMQNVAGEGRTIFFVSHNLAAVRSLCSRCVLLDGGRIIMDGSSDDVTDHYATLVEDRVRGQSDGPIKADRFSLYGSGEGYFLHPSQGEREYSMLCGDPLTLEFEIEAPSALTEVTTGVSLNAITGGRVVSMSSKVQNIPSRCGDSRRWVVRCEMGAIPLNAGTYTATIYVGNGIVDVAKFSDAFLIKVAEHDVFGWGNSLPGASSWGPMYWAPTWDIGPAIAEGLKA